MPADMTLWSYVTQWFGYIGWCASASDPSCRPFVGFLALFGASTGLLSLMVIGLVRMLNTWERAITAAGVPAAAERQREPAVREKLRRTNPESGILAGGGYAAHGEPLLPAAGALAMAAEPLHAGQPIAVPLQRLH
jgi:hypothetical protein